MIGKQDRDARLAAQLRANLARRKQGQRDATDAVDQRASASDPSDIAAPAAS
jgi:hypothetical protein